MREVCFNDRNIFYKAGDLTFQCICLHAMRDRQTYFHYCKKVHAFLEDENMKGVACLNMTEQKVGPRKPYNNFLKWLYTPVQTALYNQPFLSVSGSDS